MIQKMPKPIFFKQLVDVGEVEETINALLEKEEERQEILDLVDSTLHHAVVSRILDELAEEYHEDFMSRFLEAPENPEILIFLVEKVPDIKEKISDEGKKVKTKLLSDIKKIKK